MKKTDHIAIAARYVSALFDAAKDASALAPVEKDLRDLAIAVRDNKSLAEFMASPLLNRAQQAKIIEALAASLGVHAITQSFLVVLASQKRLETLPEIAVQFACKAQEARGEMSAQIVTAQPISKEEEAEVAAHLGKAYGKKVTLTTSQDKKLLGGAVVKIGGLQLDASLAGKLERLEQSLKAA